MVKLRETTGQDTVAPEPSETHKDFEALGETTLQLKKGSLTIEEPSIAQLKKARIAAARWVQQNEIAQFDSTLGEWEFITQLICLCTVAWAPHSGHAQTDLNAVQFDDFKASDFKKISDAVAAYVGNGDKTGTKSDEA